MGGYFRPLEDNHGVRVSSHPLFLSSSHTAQLCCDDTDADKDRRTACAVPRLYLREAEGRVIVLMPKQVTRVNAVMGRPD